MVGRLYRIHPGRLDLLPQGFLGEGGSDATAAVVIVDPSTHSLPGRATANSLPLQSRNSRIDSFCDQGPGIQRHSWAFAQDIEESLEQEAINEPRIGPARILLAPPLCPGGGVGAPLRWGFSC